MCYKLLSDFRLEQRSNRIDFIDITSKKNFSLFSQSVSHSLTTKNASNVSNVWKSVPIFIDLNVVWDLICIKKHYSIWFSLEWDVMRCHVKLHYDFLLPVLEALLYYLCSSINSKKSQGVRGWLGSFSGSFTGLSYPWKTGLKRVLFKLIHINPTK